MHIVIISETITMLCKQDDNLTWIRTDIVLIIPTEVSPF